MDYVVLLRGINVGGKNKVSMALLKGILEAAGYQNVRTYINSGNVLLSSNVKSESKLAKDVELLLESKLGFNIKVLVKSRENYANIVKTIPKAWTNDSDMKCDVMFLWDKYSIHDLKETLPIKEGIDSVFYVEGAVIWGVKRSNTTRSGLTKIIGTDVYKHMTIRNCNTARKLLVLLAT